MLFFSFEANSNPLGEALNMFQQVLEFALEMLPLYGSINWCSLLGGIRVTAMNLWVDTVKNKY